MKNKRSAFAVLILGLLIFAAAAYSSETGNVSKENPPAAASMDTLQTEDRGSDIVLLMDSSGSMKKTDPRDYRKDSARLFISLLGADDRIGIVSFGDSARTLIPLTQNSGKNRGAFVRAIGRITSKELTTDITGAVKKGISELESSKRKNRYVIIMSDGKLDLGDPEKEKASSAELMSLLPEMKKGGIRIYSIAFSELSDQKLLSEMADKTGGFFRYAAADKDIHLMFASIFEKIKSPDSVALEGDSFSIDKDIREAVLLITKQPGTATMMLDPSGRKISQGRSAKNVQWYSSSAFDMITIQDPMAGKWKVRLSSREGNKIFVLTNLKLKSSFARNSLNKGDKAVIDAWLEKDDKRIADSEILSQVSFSAELIDPGGKSLKIPLKGAEGADAGVYSVSLNINQAGDYTVRLAAEGKTFNRTKDLVFRALEPPPAPAAAAQPAPAAQPEPESEIDWQIVAIALAAATLIFIVLSGFLFASVRRYKKLYAGSLAEKQVLPAKEVPEEASAGDEESAAMRAEPENLPEAQLQEVSEAAGILESTPALEEQAARVPAESASETEESGADSARVEKLLGIIEFQKNKIAELMFVKDIFENARVRLSALQARNRLMQDKVKAVAEARGISGELQEPLSAFEDDTSELVSYILVFEKEENRLAEKFAQWEEQLKGLLDGEQYVPASKPAGASGSVAELEEKLRDAESQIADRDKRISDLQAQYEDIEKEYMILYQQKQQQQQQQQPDI